MGLHMSIIITLEYYLFIAVIVKSDIQFDLYLIDQYN